MKDGFSSPCELSDGKKDRWLFYAVISIWFSYFFSILYLHFFAVFSQKYHISPFFRILNTALILHLFLIAGIIVSYCFFSSDRKNWQKDLFFTNGKPLDFLIYIGEAAGLELLFFLPLAILALTTLKFFEYLKKLVGPDYSRYIDTVPHFKEYLMKLEWSGFALIAFLAVIIAPTIEEIVFRRVVYGYLSRRIGICAGVLITSALFAGVHLRLVDFPTLFVLGVIWQILFIYHKSLFPSILYHTFHNAIAMGILFIVKFFEISLK